MFKFKNYNKNTFLEIHTSERFYNFMADRHYHDYKHWADVAYGNIEDLHFYHSLARTAAKAIRR